MAEIPTPVDELLELITLLSEDQKVELAQKLRNTQQGIKAYQTINCALVDGAKQARERRQIP